MNSEPIPSFAERHPITNRVLTLGAATLAVLTVGDLLVTTVTHGDTVMPLAQMVYDSIID